MKYLIVLIAALVACSAPTQFPNDSSPPALTKIAVVVTSTPMWTPTPPAATILERYTVRAGDTLGAIAARYDVSIDELMRLNGLTNPNTLHIGQVLKVPVIVTRGAPGEKLLPDSEVVYSPAYASFDVNAVVNQFNGYLATYRERVEGEMLTGAQIVQLVAERYSVGPRVLLALLEHQSGWVTNTALAPERVTYPLGMTERQGLFFHLSWAANRLNEGYYGKITGRLGAFRLKDRTRVRLAANANPGTIAIQNVLAQLYGWDAWQQHISDAGFIATYRRLFGDPQQFAIEPLIPPDLKQPPLRLPWSDGELWYYTGGPHSGWGDLAAWSAVDFTPNDIAGSCWVSRRWAVAAAAGKVIRAERGRVMLSLSHNDFQGQGWVLLYLHIATTGRVGVGSIVNAGDRIGHPSCEGGEAEASHLHFARLYNGQWIGAEMLPFVLSGWTILPAEQAYDGRMTRGGELREACNCRDNARNALIADAGK
ncbi:MAG: LysM peptidoglycan-binding domain-containing M23 family metallopeptidase [Anaerolineae bacterium]|nr:LysM peptidoglycan-binding domain-containing M23 family metallopeptidase [Anaerolineae bacterium]